MLNSLRTVFRRADEFGRVSLPADFRTALGITSDTYLKLSLDGQSIIMTVGNAPCAICGKTGCSTVIEGKYLCQECVLRIKHLD